MGYMGGEDVKFAKFGMEDDDARSSLANEPVACSDVEGFSVQGKGMQCGFDEWKTGEYGKTRTQGATRSRK